MATSIFVNKQAPKLYQASFDLSSVKHQTFYEKIRLISVKTFVIINAAILDCISSLIILKNKIESKDNQGPNKISLIFQRVFNNLYDPKQLTSTASKNHHAFQTCIKTYIEKGQVMNKFFVFYEEELAKILPTIFLDFPKFTINGPNLLEKRAKQAKGFNNFAIFHGLKITEQTQKDLPRTPVQLIQKNQNIYNFGLLNQTLELEDQIKELKKYFFETLEDKSEALKIAEIAINCVHQEQIKPLHFYVQSQLPKNTYLETKKLSRLFSIIINEDNSLSIKEQLTSRLIEIGNTENFDDPKDLNLSIELSYDYKIKPNGAISDTKYLVTFI